MHYPTVVLSNFVDRLKGISEEFHGLIFGLNTNKERLLLGFSVETEDVNVSSIENGNIVQPGGVEVCGIVITLKNSENINNKIIDRCNALPVRDPLIVVKYENSEDLDISQYEENSIRKTSWKVISAEEFSKKFVTFHVKGAFSLSLTFPPTQSDIDSNVHELKNQLINSMHLNWGPNEDLEENETIGNISHKLSRKKDYRYSMEFIEVEIFAKHSLKLKQVSLTDYEIASIQDSQKMAKFRLAVSCLCLINRNTVFSEVYEILRSTVLSTLELHNNFICSNLNNDSLSCPMVRHYFCRQIGYPLSLILPSEQTGTVLDGIRETVHKKLHLSLETPFRFREGSSLHLVPVSTSPSPLINVHQGLTPTVVGGTARVVGGDYAYYHYGQKGVNDHGWGCAYRSLQTVFSWFRLQGFTDANVPSIKEIQECLVRMGDKPKEIIGSKTWIGSTEVSYCLDQLLGVSSYIHNFPDREALRGLALQLFVHFQFSGPPVMIGGGLLAHTIIGIDLNEETGDMKFLVVDPHYPGEDNRHLIQKSGSVGWKDVSFFNQPSFYNVCVPMIPSVY